MKSSVVPKRLVAKGLMLLLMMMSFKTNEFLWVCVCVRAHMLAFFSRFYLNHPMFCRSPKGRRYIHPNGTLHIRKVVHRVRGKVKMSDEGIYECYVTNSVGTVLAQRLQLFIASERWACSGWAFVPVEC